MPAERSRPVTTGHHDQARLTGRQGCLSLCAGRRVRPPWTCPGTSALSVGRPSMPVWEARASDGAGGGVEQVLQARHDGLKAGALGWLAGPAVGHELQVAGGHVGRYRRPVPREHLEQDLQRQQSIDVMLRFRRP